MVNYSEMKKDLSEYRAQFETFKEQILKELDAFIYRYERYGQEFSALLVYAENTQIDIEVCHNSVRKSDRVFVLSENLILVAFDMASEATALKAAQNFQYNFMQHDVRQELFLALAPIDQADTAIDIASRLLIILDYALNENIPDIIVELDTMRSK
jgi:hypothetical protein